MPATRSLLEGVARPRAGRDQLGVCAVGERVGNVLAGQLDGPRPAGRARGRACRPSAAQRPGPPGRHGDSCRLVGAPCVETQHSGGRYCNARFAVANRSPLGGRPPRSGPVPEPTGDCRGLSLAPAARPNGSACLPLVRPESTGIRCATIRGRAGEPPASQANSLTKPGLAPSAALARHSDDLALSPRLRLGVADHPPSAFGFVRVVSERGKGLVVRASVGGRGRAEPPGWG
jgi:hypothetical protein